MPKNKKRNNNHQYRNRNNQANGSNNVGGVQKWSHNNKNGGGGGGGHRNNNNNRKIIFKPSLINALEEEQDGYEMRSNNNNDNNNTQHDQNELNRNNNNRKNRKKRQNRGVIESLKSLGVVKEKLVIGEDDESQVTKFIPSLLHCRVSSIPEDVFAMIVSYVQDYFTCYDDSRERLLGAYNPKVLFSFCLNQGHSSAHVQYKIDEIYFQKNRNLRRLVGHEGMHKRHRLLVQGQVETVAYLNKLPRTEHEARSIRLDSCFFMPNMITFVVTGVFKEGKPGDKMRPNRSFSRSFVCIPDAVSRMTIINEQFVLAHVTHDQFMTYYHDKPVASSQVTNENVPPALQQITTTPTTSSSSMPPELIGLNEQQVQIIHRFSAESRLNFEWCKYILEHANWVYEQAGNSFITHQQNIPKEAYLS